MNKEYLAQTNLPIGSKSVEFRVTAGNPIFFFGPNGAGKSALMHYLANRLGENVIYQPSSRPNYFESESSNLTAEARRQLGNAFKSWNSSQETRYRSLSGAARNEKAMHDLQSAETQYKIDASNQIAAEGSESPAIARLQAKQSPVDRVNSLLKQANLKFILDVVNTEIRAKKNNFVYSYAKLSDGERAAVIFAADVIAAPTKSVFLIDEPESHFHPSIAVPLIKALILERCDCGFVFSSHQLELAHCVGLRTIYLIRDCAWQNNQPISWEIQKMDAGSDLPMELLADIVGSKSKMLMVEGSSASLDQPLYNLLFPNVSVHSKSNCREVIQSVAGLRSTFERHKVEAYGIIDGDGMNQETASDFEKKGVFPLPVYSVESLYYSVEVIQAVAQVQGEHLKRDSDSLFRGAIDAALSSLNEQQMRHLASRVVERRVRENVIEKLPDRKAIIESNSNNCSINIPTNYLEEVQRLERLISERKSSEIFSIYPIRESGIASAIIAALHLVSQDDYERLVLKVVGENSELRASLKAKLSAFAEKIDGSQEEEEEGAIEDSDSGTDGN